MNIDPSFIHTEHISVTGTDQVTARFVFARAYEYTESKEVMGKLYLDASNQPFSLSEVVDRNFRHMYHCARLWDVVLLTREEIFKYTLAGKI